MNEAMLCFVPNDDSIPLSRSLVLKIRIICLGGGGRVMRRLMIKAKKTNMTKRLKMTKRVKMTKCVKMTKRNKRKLKIMKISTENDG